MSVQKSFAHNTQRVETIQMPIIWAREKCGISIQKLLFSNLKKAVTENMMNKSQNKDCKFCSTFYMKFLKQANCGDRNKSLLLSRGQGQEEGIGCKGSYGIFYGMMECSIL